MLTKFADLLLGFLGRDDYGSKPGSYFEAFIKELSQFTKIADVLPYESFDETRQLFINHDGQHLVLDSSHPAH